MLTSFTQGANWARADIAIKLLKMDLPEDVRLFLYKELHLDNKITDADVPAEIK
jgi:hypothetical protein